MKLFLWMTSRATVRDIRIRLYAKTAKTSEVKTPKCGKPLACQEEWKMSLLPESWITANDRDFKSSICTFWVQKVKAIRRGREKLHPVVQSYERATKKQEDVVVAEGNTGVFFPLWKEKKWWEWEENEEGVGVVSEGLGNSEMAVTLRRVG